MKDLNEVYRKSGLGKWFHDESAGGKPGWDRYNSKGERVGECGDAKKGEPYAACLSKQKAAKLGKEKIGSFVNRKRAAQSAAGRGKKGSGGKGKKPINVDTGVNEQYDVDKKGPSRTPGESMDIDKRNKRFKTPPCMIDDKSVKMPEYEKHIVSESKFKNKSFNAIIQEAKELLEKNIAKSKKKWSSCKTQAKRKFDVYPSAYANAWASKCYKKKGGKWKAVNESEQMPYDAYDSNVDSSQEDADEANKTAFKPEKLPDDLPVEKILKSKNGFNSKKLRLEYFKNLLNRTEELNEEI
jgi:hypothetical protein